uniref:Uncharacterized protein n=1 Tax=Emiliania huxleyi TaxID=2903 RepID=A0A6T0EBN0_EMIHU
MSTSSSSTLGRVDGSRTIRASASAAAARCAATSAPRSLFHSPKLTTCAVRLSPEPEERALRTIAAEAADGSGQCSRARSTACWSVSTSQTPSHPRMTNKSS